MNPSRSIDRAHFLKANPRYATCFRETTGEGWARAVAAAGYATDPAYADKLIAVMRGRKMAQYDVQREAAGARSSAYSLAPCCWCCFYVAARWQCGATAPADMTLVIQPLSPRERKPGKRRPWPR